MILIHGFPEPLGTKYYGLDTPVIGFQFFAEIHFVGYDKLKVLLAS